MTTKQQIINELETHDFPNLKFLFSEEVLNMVPELLEEFLEEEKKDFDEKLKLDNSKISFSIFDEESKMSYFWSILNHFNNVASSDFLRKIIDEFEPKLVEFWNELSYSKRYFEMLVYCSLNCDLDIEQTKIISDSIKWFKVRWINLDKDKQEELKQINKQLSELTTKFSNNVLDDEKQFEYFLEDDEFLKELPESDLQNAKNLAEKKWKKWFAFDSSGSSYLTIMKYCVSSDIRKYFSDIHSSFASNWKYDNRENVLKIINLKNTKSKLLGYENYWELSLEFKMAESPKQVLELLESLSKKAKKKALLEVEEVRDYFDLKQVNAWDMWYYSRILKKEKYNLDDKKLKEYFEFENTKKALFDTVENLYWIVMKQIEVEWIYEENIELFQSDKACLEYLRQELNIFYQQ